jgi:hypothetical protein
MEFAYCVSWHSSIKTNPFYAPYGQECLTPFLFQHAPLKWKDLIK